MMAIIKVKTFFNFAKVTLCFIILQSLSICHASPQSDVWQYGQGENGVPNWHGECNEGKFQSPIDIPLQNGKYSEVKFQPFTFARYNEEHDMVILNNGHSLQFELSPTELEAMPEEQPFVADAGLPGSRFVFVQGHFHWGSVDTQGSEHKLGGEVSPAEMHLVHYNYDRGVTLSKAIQNRHYDSLAVISIMLQIVPEDNEQLQPLFTAMTKVKKENHDKKVPFGKMALSPLLPRNTDHFYRYNGSLTTPGCGEIVVWTIFKDPIYVSRNQLNILRRTTYGDRQHRQPLVDNFRPLQKLNNRKILNVDTSTKRFESGASAPKISHLGFVTSIFLVVQLITPQMAFFVY